MAHMKRAGNGERKRSQHSRNRVCHQQKQPTDKQNYEYPLDFDLGFSIDCGQNNQVVRTRLEVEIRREDGLQT